MSPCIFVCVVFGVSFRFVMLLLRALWCVCSVCCFVCVCVCCVCVLFLNFVFDSVFDVVVFGVLLLVFVFDL